MTRYRFLTNISRWLMVLVISGAFGAFVRSEAPAAPADEKDAGALLSRLKESKISLADGIRQAEKTAGRAISAKFEIEEGKLNLSVYTAKDGLDKDAEHNTLMELSGDATQSPWTPKTEVFKDKEHIARAAMHLTLMQLTKLSLADVAQKAASQQKGTVYSITPAVHDGKPVFDVLVATADGKSVPLMLDIRTGNKIAAAAKGRPTY